MAQGQYFAADKKDEIEYERLSLFAGAYDPYTIRQLKELGVSKGWKCLDVGAGGGSIAQWLAQVVGLSGKVVATDINTRFIRHLSMPNLEVRQHNILTDPLETDYYDLVHCRALLQHLKEYEKALKIMAAAVRPGGWLFIEDHDFGSYLLNHLTESSNLNTHPFRKMHLFIKKAMFDPYFGRNERSLIESLGLYDVGHQGWTQLVHPNDPFFRFYIIITEYFQQPAIANGVLTQEQYDSLKKEYVDSTNTFFDSILFGAWGRKPASNWTKAPPSRTP